jgi:hypothetical protein
MQHPLDAREPTGAEGTTRRRLLGLCGVTAATALAGCGGGGGDGGDGSDGSDGGDGDSGGGGSSGGDATADGGDGGAATDTDGDGGDGGDGGGSSGGSNAFGETLKSESSYAFEGTADTGTSTGPIEGRIADGDFYLRIDPEDQEASEFYSVDGTQYVVSGGQCFITGQDEDTAPARVKEDREENADVTPSGRETIDGQEVFVYEIPTGAGGTATYYVSTDTGYPVRFESDDSELNFHSWGDVEAVEKPDMDCQEMGGQGGGGMSSGALAPPFAGGR